MFKLGMNMITPVINTPFLGISKNFIRRNTLAKQFFRSPAFVFIGMIFLSQQTIASLDFFKRSVLRYTKKIVVIHSIHGVSVFDTTTILMFLMPTSRTLVPSAFSTSH